MVSDLERDINIRPEGAELVGEAKRERVQSVKIDTGQSA
jgi:hypothetical protein